jgi:large subunit ribosomal protein L25
MELEIKTRTVFGSKLNALRKEGLVPAEVYGHEMENLHVAVEEKAFLKMYRVAGENTIITLVHDGEKIPALVAEVAINPLTGRPIAVDFHKVRMDEKIRTNVPIVLTGKNTAKENGFDLLQTLDECEVEALPNNLPHEFKVDTSGLANLGESIHIKDLPILSGVKMITPPDTIIAAVTEKPEEEIVEKPVTPETPVAEEKKETTN